MFPVCCPQILGILPTFGGSVGMLFHLLLGGCYASLYTWIFLTVVPLHEAAVAAGMFVFTVAMLYAKQPPVVTKVCARASLCLVVYEAVCWKILCCARS